MTQQAQRRLTPAEIASFRRRLSEPQPPTETRALVEEMSEVAGWHLLCQAGLSGLWRDAFIACHVGVLKGATVARLVEAERPDFAIVVEGQELLYEATQADQPGRQMSREYRDLIDAHPDADPGPEDDSYEDVAARAANAPLMLETAARLKATGDYDPSWGLVIYLNLGEYGWFKQQVECCMETATAPAHDLFREVLVLWKDRLYEIGAQRHENRSPHH